MTAVERFGRGLSLKSQLWPLYNFCFKRGIGRATSLADMLDAFVFLGARRDLCGVREESWATISGKNLQSSVWKDRETEREKEREKEDREREREEKIKEERQKQDKTRQEERREKREDERQEKMKRGEQMQKMFEDPQTRQIISPKCFEKNPFRTNYSSFFLPKFRI